MRIFTFKLDNQFITESANETNNQDLELQQLGNHLLRWKAGQTDRRTDGQTDTRSKRSVDSRVMQLKSVVINVPFFFPGSQV